MDAEGYKDFEDRYGSERVRTRDENRILPTKRESAFWKKENASKGKVRVYKIDPRTKVVTAQDSKKKFRLDQRLAPKFELVPIQETKPVAHKKVVLTNSYFKTEADAMAQIEIDGALTLTDGQCAILRKRLTNLKGLKLPKKVEKQRLAHADYAGCWPQRVVSLMTGGAAIIEPKAKKVKPPKPPKPPKIPSAYGVGSGRRLPRNKSMAYALSKKPEKKIWTGSDNVPAIGERVNIGKENLGRGVVVAYFFEYRFLGVEVKLDKRPTWHLRQCKDKYPNPLVFGETITIL